MQGPLLAQLPSHFAPSLPKLNISNCDGVPPTGEANPIPGSVQGQDQQDAEQPGLNLGREGSGR